MEEKQKYYKTVNLEEWLKTNPDEKDYHGFTNSGIKLIFRYVKNDPELAGWITHVLVETSIKELIEKRLPTEEEIKDYIKSRKWPSGWDSMSAEFICKWFRNKILKEG